jgi:hypothetical protein
MVSRPKRLPNIHGEYQCIVCHTWKHLGDYHKDSTAANGKKSTCKPCGNLLNRHKKRYTRYGLTRHQFEEKFEAQNGQCASCEVELELDGRRTRSPCVDHNHSTGEIRDIICTRCNLAAGNLKDSSERARKLMEYLKKWKC